MGWMGFGEGVPFVVGSVGSVLQVICKRTSLHSRSAMRLGSWRGGFLSRSSDNRMFAHNVLRNAFPCLAMEVSIQVGQQGHCVLSIPGE